MLRCSIPLLILASALSAQTSISVSGHVYSKDGKPPDGAVVTITGIGDSASQYTAKPDPVSGFYSVANLTSGTYKIEADGDGYSPQIRDGVTLSKSATFDFALEPICANCSGGRRGERNYTRDFGLTFLVVFLYLASIFLVRWNNIAGPNRQMIEAEIDKMRTRGPGAAVLLDQAHAAIEPNWRTAWRDFLFWTRGQEFAAWARIHEFQRTLIPATVQEARAQLQAIELDLVDIDKTHAKTLATNIKTALEASAPDLAALQALWVESLTYLNDETDSLYAQLVTWQTKAVWLTGVGCCLIVVLAFLVGNPVLFVAGGAGGLLGRLSRTLKRADVPTDYGASWTTLFLSPVVGSLSGWFGILLVVLLSDKHLAILGPTFEIIQWCCPLAPFTLALAFAFGFSERLFDGIVSSLEDKVDEQRQSATKQQQPTSQVKVDKT